VGGLYCSDSTTIAEPYHVMNMKIVSANKLKYTKREFQRADEAMELRRRHSFPADETLLKYQSIINIPIISKDIAKSIDR
jgi:hypothetical protein